MFLRCLVDAKLTASNSRFMPRVQDDKLQFQLEAFKFQQESSGSVSNRTTLLAEYAFLLWYSPKRWFVAQSLLKLPVFADIHYLLPEGCASPIN